MREVKGGGVGVASQHTDSVVPGGCQGATIFGQNGNSRLIHTGRNWALEAQDPGVSVDLERGALRRSGKFEFYSAISP